MTQHVTHRGRRTYNNASNQKKIRRTPGNKLVYIPKKKFGIMPKCNACKARLHGIDMCNTSKFSRLRKSQRTVTRAYAGNLCGTCLETRILGAFLGLEENILSKKQETVGDDTN